jgi:hypothetical protein
MISTLHCGATASVGDRVPEPGVAGPVAAPQPTRFLHEPEAPLQPAALHPQWTLPLAADAGQHEHLRIRRPTQSRRGWFCRVGDERVTTHF